MRVLIVGLGSIARKHIAALREMYGKDVEILALRSSKPSKTEEDIQNIYSWKDVQEKPDFVLISNPTVHHAVAIQEALALKVPLFIEKPALSDLAKAEELEELIAAANIPTYVACNLRFHAPLMHLKQYLDSGEYGKINEVNVYCGSDLSAWRPDVDFRQTYSASAKMGGGVHLDLIHEIDYIYWFFGKPALVNSIRRSSSHLEMDAVDYANYQLVYKDYVVSILLNYFRKDYKRQVEVVTSLGTFLCDLKQNTIHFNHELIFENQHIGFIDTYKKQLTFFIKIIQAGGKIENDFKEGIEVLKIALSG